MDRGRPLKFKTAAELEKKIQEYFDSCDKEKRPYTISGLAVALDTYRSLLLDYEEKEEFYYTIKKAKQKCEKYAEEMLFRGQVVAGVIFNLKNNYKNWKDKQEVEHSTDKPLEIKIVDDKPTDTEF